MEGGGMSPRKLMGQSKTVPWKQIGSMSTGAGAFGISPHLGGKPFVPNPDGNRRFSELPDSQRACGHPSNGYQRHPRH